MSLALGLTAGTIPGAAFAADSLHTQFSKLSTKSTSLLQSSKGTYISPKINTKSSAEVRVIVQLSGQPAAVGKYAVKQGISSLAKSATEAAVTSQQSTVLDKAKDEGLDLKVNYRYNTVFNGFEVTVPANEIPELADIPGVKSIYENSTWYPIPVEEADAEINGTLQYGASPLHQIGADAAWAKEITGAGLKVGVIDTGVDYLHPDIAPAYKGGWDSFYNDNDPYEEEPNADLEFEGTSHGTHVSGTIVGRFANPTSEIVQKGVAYGADLYVYKVLGYNPANPSSASGSSAQVIDGIERSVRDGMDVINLSLGSDAEKDVNSPDAIAINNAVLSGVTAVIANGNAGPGANTLGSPATSQLGISVGAATSPAKNFHVNFQPSFTDPETVTSVTYTTYSDLNVMSWEIGDSNFKDIIGTEPVKAVYAGLGSEKDFSQIPADKLQDSIAFVSRGVLTFTDKIANAKKYGAKAIVIFNGIGTVLKDNTSVVDLSDDIPGRNGYIDNNIGDVYNSIPTFDMKGSEGRLLAKTIIANPDVTFTFGDNYNETNFDGDTLASFSSEGPNVDANLSIKPDFIAPGVGILSTWPAYQKYDEFKNASYDEAYNRISGTSMASPHVAGLALLLKQAHPTWGPFEIRAALANTAKVLDGYNVYEQGAGRVNVADAINTPALLESLEPITILDKNFQPQNVINYNSSANFGVVAPGASKVENLQIKNTESASLTYTASVKWHGTEPAGIKADLSQVELVVAGYQSKAFSLNVNVGNDAESGFYEGQVTLTAPNLPTLHLPFSVYVGTELPDSPVGIQEISLTHPVIYPKLSTQATTDLSFKLTADDANLYELDVYNLDDELIGYKDYYDTVKEATYFEPKVYNFESLDNSYYKYDEDGQPVFDANGEPSVGYLTDGIYKLNIVFAHITAQGKATNIYNGFISLRVDNSTGISSGGGSAGGGAPSGGGGASGGTTTTTPTVPDSAASLVDQGFKQVTVTPATTVQNGVTTITISDSDLKAALANATTAQTAVIISAPSVTGSAAKISLTADQVKLLAAISSASKVIVSTKDAAVSLPVTLFSSAPAGATFDLSIKPASEEAGKFTAGAAGSSVIGAPVSFEGSWTTVTGSTYLTVPSNTFIKRSFTVPGSIAANTAGVLFEENGKITPVSSVFKTQADGTTLVIVNRPGFSTYAAVSRPVTFSDIAGSPAASDITALANKLIFRGTSATTFSPKSNLTRAEFTALLVRALGLRTDASVNFTDVKATDWYAGDVAAATKAGLILGVGGGKFAPKANVSRQEVAVILDRAVKLAGIELKPASPSFTIYTDNAKIASYAKDSVQSLSAAGIISGDSGSVFNPTAPATRETIATVLRQLLVKGGLAE
ncbi:S8 family serine peptidase [Paenibacillus sophorae]|nr:S8 family serine peptidase [Paenibacillus sophorae]